MNNCGESVFVMTIKTYDRLLQLRLKQVTRSVHLLRRGTFSGRRQRTARTVTALQAWVTTTTVTVAMDM